MKFKRILCLFNRHSPIRHRVELGQSGYVGTCKRCGTRIYRRDHKDWRKRRSNFSSNHAH